MLTHRLLQEAERQLALLAKLNRLGDENKPNVTDFQLGNKRKRIGIA